MTGATARSPSALPRNYATIKNVSLRIAQQRVANGRYMYLRFGDGRSATIVFDQGFGAWKAPMTGAAIQFDFRAPPLRQAGALAKNTATVGKSGIGPTYLVATVD